MRQLIPMPVLLLTLMAGCLPRQLPDLVPTATLREPTQTALPINTFTSTATLTPVTTSTPTNTPTPPPIRTAQPENESLMLEVPAGFKIDYSGKQHKTIISEMVPYGDSADDWTTMVSVMVFLGLTDCTPEQFQEFTTQSWFDECSESESFPIESGDENGYNFVIWQLYCPLEPSTQKMQKSYFKAIQGNDSFYAVKVGFRYEPSSDEITQWMQYLKEVQVCDSRIPEQACP